ncbi:hypothetical protein [Rubritalea tangerina]
MEKVQHKTGHFVIDPDVFGLKGKWWLIYHSMRMRRRFGQYC